MEDKPGGVLGARAALSSLRAIESLKPEYSKHVSELKLEVKAIAAEVLEGLRAKYANEGKKTIDGLELIGARLIVDGDTLQGWILAGSASQKAGSTVRHADGYRVEFSSSVLEPSAIEWALHKEVADSPLPNDDSLFSAELKNKPHVKSKVSRLVELAESTTGHENRLKNFWTSQPANFANHWGAVIATDLERVASSFAQDEKTLLQREINHAIRSKDLVIERDVGDEGEDKYSFCLPSFDISFGLEKDGACRIDSIVMRKKFLFWKQEKAIYASGARQAGEPAGM